MKELTLNDISIQHIENKQRLEKRLIHTINTIYGRDELLNCDFGWDFDYNQNDTQEQQIKTILKEHNRLKAHYDYCYSIQIKIYNNNKNTKLKNL